MPRINETWDYARAAEIANSNHQHRQNQTKEEEQTLSKTAEILEETTRKLGTVCPPDNTPSAGISSPESPLGGPGSGSVEATALEPLFIPSVYPVFLGLDPGAEGGLVALCGPEGTPLYRVDTFKTSGGDDMALWEWLSNFQPSKCKVSAVLEEQQPRPTRWKGKSSILRSTCILYGHYQLLRGMLIALGIQRTYVLPQRWQKSLGLVRAPEETDTKWKNRLKARAQQLFPEEQVTLATADAYLLARYCRLLYGGASKARTAVPGRKD